jgi:alpha-D-xyloside xylohydrolase
MLVAADFTPIDEGRMIPLSLLLLLAASTATIAQTLSLDRNGQMIMIEPYAPNVVRVTLSLIAKEAEAGPGYGFVAKPEWAGWKHTVAEDRADVYGSPRMSVVVSPARRRNPNGKMPDTAKFFSGSTAGARVTVTLPDGSPLAEMDGWQMAQLNQKDDTLKNARGIKPEDLPLYTVGASFRARDDEHYYGLGENQEGYLDHR